MRCELNGSLIPNELLVHFSPYLVIAKFWSRSDTSIPTPNQSSSTPSLAAKMPDTVPATPCPLVKRLQPLQRSLCNV